jgi:hypothetical protein
MTRFIRVKNKTTGHEFDLPVQSFDPEKYSRVARYPEVTRPRRPKPNVRKGGKRTAPVTTDKE